MHLTIAVPSVVVGGVAVETGAGVGPLRVGTLVCTGVTASETLINVCR